MSISSKPQVVLVDIWRVVNAKGGTEKVFCEMANGLTQRGYKVTAICHDENQGNPGFKLREEVDFINAFRKPCIFDKEPIRSIRSFRFDREKSREQRHFVSCYWKAQNIKRSFSSWDKADVLISFQPETTFILKEILQLANPVVTMFHLTPERFISSKSYSFRRCAVDASVCIQVLVPEYIDILKKVHPNANIVCIPNVAPQYEDVSPLTEKRIINVARVSPQKRPDLLLKAFALIKDQYPDWACEWYGEAEVHEECTRQIQELIKNNKLEDRFLFMGPTNEIPKKLKSSSIFAFPSEYEGLSLALLEAMSAGLPIVGCVDCPSMKSTVQDGVNGFLVHPQANEFAKALSKLMDSYDLRQKLGTQSKSISKMFSPTVVWKQWDNLIQSIIKH